MSSGPARAKLRLPQRGPLVAGAVIVTCLAVVAVVLLRPSAEPALKPPELTSPTTVEVSNADSRLVLKPGRDYIVELPDTPITARGGVWIVGGRNVVVIGGEIRNEQPISSSESVGDAYGLFLEDQTGTVHVEGLWIHGHGIGQAPRPRRGRRSNRAGANVPVRAAPPRRARSHRRNPELSRALQPVAVPCTIRLPASAFRRCRCNTGRCRRNWSYRRVNVEQTTLTPTRSGRRSTRRLVARDPPRLLGGEPRFLAWPSPAHWNPDGPANVTGEDFRISEHLRAGTTCRPVRWARPIGPPDRDRRDAARSGRNPGAR